MAALQSTGYTSEKAYGSEGATETLGGDDTNTKSDTQDPHGGGN